MSEQIIVNGVNVAQLMDTINTIKERPDIAKFQFRASNTWIDGTHNRTTIREFYGAGQEDTTRTTVFRLDSDEPGVLLGKDTAANPAEYLLAALAACMTTSLVAHAAARGITVEKVESRFEGDIDLHGFLGLSDRVRNGFENIRVTFKLKADAPMETLEELVRVAQQRSPIFDVVTNPVPVSVGVERM